MSVRHGSFFADRRVSIAKILLLLYIWATSPTQSIRSVKKQTGLDEVTIIHMYNRFRDITHDWCKENLQPVKIGGPGRIVEIDESVFYKTKYQRGRRREHDWVFGMVERGTNRLMLVPVADRSAATLVTVIQQYIEDGKHEKKWSPQKEIKYLDTRIISDGWAAYGALNALRVQVGNVWYQKYHHEWVNHRINFVDPNDRTIHTQSIEATWKNVKQSLNLSAGRGVKCLHICTNICLNGHITMPKSGKT